MADIHEDKILILDFGSQYTQLIARRIRELKVYCEIHPFNMDPAQIKGFKPTGIIFSGGPASVHWKGAPTIDAKVLRMGVPVLGICYGMQLIAQLMGGKVLPAERREYGFTRMDILDSDTIFNGWAQRGDAMTVWMSHGDSVKTMPGGFSHLGRSDNSPVAAFQNEEARIYGVQFHPEVSHTPGGVKILENFLFDVCGCRPLWTMRSFVDTTVSEVRELVGDSKVICALSGGVDSSVVAMLIFQAIGKRLIPIFVDNGVLRKGEAEEVKDLFGHELGMELHFVNASGEFIEGLKGVVDPEEKRRKIGNLFIELFEKEAKSIPGVEFLAQGTLYPDVIESVSFRGPSATIKTHHNVGGLPEKMNLKLIEPLRELFKDEVRQVAEEIGLPPSIVGRHPFPGPGLAIRILGEVTEDRLAVLRHADSIVIEEIRKADLYDRVWQAFAVLLPVQTVGVMGDERTYENVAAVRVVESVDAMTADWARMPHDVLERLSNRIINEVRGINRVVYDISSKPPATIEWE